MDATLARFLATSAAALGLAAQIPAAHAGTLGEHPAVIVAKRGPAAYDYAASFYLHPARLELLAEAPPAQPGHAGAAGPALPADTARGADPAAQAGRRTAQ